MQAVALPSDHAPTQHSVARRAIGVLSCAGRGFVSFVCLLLLPVLAMVVILCAAVAVAVGLARPFVEGEWCADVTTRGYLVLTGWSLLAASAHGTTGGES